LRAEYADLSPKNGPGAWYEHSYWSMKNYGRVFGHHAGTDSDDLFIELWDGKAAERIVESLIR
jgi:lipid-binding SYLF domain-containing protein